MNEMYVLEVQDMDDATSVPCTYQDNLSLFYKRQLLKLSWYVQGTLLTFVYIPHF